ncbi:MAG: hypothetical protein RLZ36_490 [Pseudomonadota bacterium]
MSTLATRQTLAEFGTLSDAEQKLLAYCCNKVNGIAEVGESVPTHDSGPSKVVRSKFLRFLLLGGDETMSVSESGILLQGALIKEPLHLIGCAIPNNVAFVKCRFTEKVALINARIRGELILTGSHLDQDLRADGLTVEGNVHLDKGFTATAQVTLIGSDIRGDLLCGAGKFLSKDSPALKASQSKVAGDVNLNEGFEARGLVDLNNIQIGGTLNCTGGSFNPPKGAALTVDCAEIRRNIFFRNGFKATGEVSLVSTQIGMNFDCSQATFAPHTGPALRLALTTVKYAWCLQALKTTACIDASHMQVYVLRDDMASWGESPSLNGFVYQTIDSQSPTDAHSRTSWLNKQSSSHVDGEMTRDFYPQPWLQLRKCLRQNGYFEAAREVGMAFENQMRVANRLGQSSDPQQANSVIASIHRHLVRSLHWAFGFLAGYGYRPLRLCMSSAVVWIICGAIYWLLALPPYNAIGPTDPLVFQKPMYAACTKKENGNWFLCAELPAEYTTLSPLAYSLDILLPLVDLGQEKAWGPLVPSPERHFCTEFFTLDAAHLVRLLNWFEILYGWMASLLFVAIVSGLAKRSEGDV